MNKRTVISLKWIAMTVVAAFCWGYLWGNILPNGLGALITVIGSFAIGWTIGNCMRAELKEVQKS